MEIFLKLLIIILSIPVIIISYLISLMNNILISFTTVIFILYYIVNMNVNGLFIFSTIISSLTIYSLSKFIHNKFNKILDDNNEKNKKDMNSDDLKLDKRNVNINSILNKYDI